MSALERSLKDIVAAHGLCFMAVEIHSYDDESEVRFSVQGQWLDDSKSHGRGIASGDGKTIDDATRGFMAELAEIRTSSIDGELAA